MEPYIELRDQNSENLAIKSQKSAVEFAAPLEKQGLHCRFLGEVTKQVFSNLVASKYQMAEYRISIYGRKQSGWDQLATWIVNNDLYSENVVWLIQMASEMNDIDDPILWSPPIEKLFIQIMVEEVNKLNTLTPQFTPKMWKTILDEMLKRSKKTITLKQLKQKYNRLRQKHREFAALLDQTGFGWDAETNTVTASEENWQNYLRAHPYAKCFRKKGCDHYNLLGVIFDKTTATGTLHYSSAQDPPNTDEEIDLEDDFINIGCHINSTNPTQDDPEVVTGEGSSRRRRSLSTSNDRRVRKEARTRDMDDAIFAWAEASKAKTERYKSKSKSSEATSVFRDQFSLSACVECLDDMELIDDATYLKALEKFKDSDWREMFIKIPMERKKAWLASL